MEEEEEEQEEEGRMGHRGRPGTLRVWHALMVAAREWQS